MNISQQEALYEARKAENLQTQGIHPAPSGFSEQQLKDDPILRHFHFAHLPEQLRGTSVKFYELAWFIISTVPRNPERTVALRKLLEAKDAAVRANVG
jgi:hypothetical protein